MRKTDVLSHFGTQQKVADALSAAGARITQRGVSGWGDVIPLGRAFVIEKITDGKLRVDMSLYQQRTRQPAQ
jgi:hypothetical protein